VDDMCARNKSGFTLIELMITLIIASFLVVTLNRVLQQSSLARLFVERRVRDGFFIGTLAQELTYDFSGITTQYAAQESEEKEKQKKVTPPIQIGRGPDNTIQELRFFSVNAREYKKHHVPTEIVYTLLLSDKTKKTYTLTRELKTQESSKRREFQAPPVAFLDNITKCTVQFVKQKSKDETKKEGEIPFILLDEWSLKEQKQESQNQTAEKKSQKTEFEDISHIRITITYIKNERGTIESITLLIPIFLNKQPETPETPGKKPEIETQPKKVAKKKAIQDSNKEELVLLEDRTTSMLKLMFKGSNG